MGLRRLIMIGKNLGSENAARRVYLERGYEYDRNGPRKVYI
jgi:hypothetical protein